MSTGLELLGEKNIIPYGDLSHLTRRASGGRRRPRLRTMFVQTEALPLDDDYEEDEGWSQKVGSLPHALTGRRRLAYLTLPEGKSCPGARLLACLLDRERLGSVAI